MSLEASIIRKHFATMQYQYHILRLISEALSPKITSQNIRKRWTVRSLEEHEGYDYMVIQK